MSGFIYPVIEILNMSRLDRAVQSLPRILCSALQAVAEVTGRVMFVSTAGPNPGDKGHIYQEKIKVLNDET